MRYRRLTQALIAAIWILQSKGTCGQMCSPKYNFEHLQEDKAITGSTFLTLTGLGLVGCSKQCLLRSACQSFNYEPRTQECQLNKKNSSTTETENVKEIDGTISSDIAYWPTRLAGACSSRSCPSKSICLEEINDMICKIECPNPVLENGNFTSPISHEVGTTLTFECDATFNRAGGAKCRTDGRWTFFRCIAPPLS